MDKHTQGKLVWGLFLFVCFVAFWSNCKAWAAGEIIRTYTSGPFKRRKIRRDENPQLFQRYLFANFIINAFFFLVVVIWGIGLFFWS
jgi:hypothetical protein